ncbi:hypothetical protein IID19_05030 [Patescibacteria group bacterium]|nr:hypothetical protein [Patescibacteria group bacterium]
MIFLITVFLTLRPIAETDSTLVQLCEARNLEYEEILSVFQTLDSTLLIEQKYYLDSSSYYTINVLSDDISVDSFQTILDVTLPPSSITTSEYHMVISHKVDGEMPDTCTVLIICFYNKAAENNLPIARLTYCTSTGTQRYEYITQPRSLHYLRESKTLSY